MSEKLMQPRSAEFQQPQAAPESYRERIRRGLRSAGEAAYSLLDVNAGIALARVDIKHEEATMDSLNQRYDGMLERQSQDDKTSMALEHDIVTAHRAEIQREGVTHDEIPAARRFEMAESTVALFLEDIAEELSAHHPDWTVEEVALAATQRARDIIAILAMDSGQQETYEAAVFEYNEARDEIADLQVEAEALKEERRQRLGSIGNVAVKALFGFGSRLRNMPYEMSAKLTIAGANVARGVREWYGSKSAEDKRTVLFSAASVAVAGIAAYVTVRLNGGHSSHASGNFILAGNETTFEGQPVDATRIGGSEAIDATRIGSGGHIDATRIGGGEAIDATRIGGERDGAVDATRIGGEPAVDATRIGGETGAVDATRIGGETGSIDAARIGGETGPVDAEVIGGGIDLSGAKTTEELFGSKQVSKWPDVIKVSEWDVQTKDGSLWGISTEMLERSGVKNPSDNQVQKLVEALRPQAGADGMLRVGQALDLRPAVELLPNTK